MNSVVSKLSAADTPQDTTYQALLAAVQERAGLIALIDNSATVRTRLLRKLMDEPPANIELVYCPSGTATFDELLNIICDTLDLTVLEPNRPRRLKALKDYLNDRDHSKRAVTLIIDEAHLLQNNVLDYLLTFTYSGLLKPKAWQLLCCGTIELADHLEQQRVNYSNLKEIKTINLAHFNATQSTNEVPVSKKKPGQKTDREPVQAFAPATIERITHQTENASEASKPEKKPQTPAPARPATAKNAAAAGSAPDPAATAATKKPAPKKSALFSLSWSLSPVMFIAILLAAIAGITSVILLHDKKEADENNTAAAASAPSPAAIVSAASTQAPAPAAPASEAAEEQTTAPAATGAVANELPATPSLPLRTAGEVLLAAKVDPGTSTRKQEKPAAPDAQQIAFYIRRAKGLLELGDIASARLFFQACVEAGDPECMIAVGATYDPQQLRKQGLAGVYVDPIQAMEWYDRALRAGADQAADEMQSLRAWLADFPDITESAK